MKNMKITIDRRVFSSALSEVAPFAPQKAPVSILKYAKVTTKGNRMKIEANDTQKSMTRYVRLSECDEDNSFLIDIAGMNKFIAKTSGDFIGIEVDGETIRVRHAKGSAEFQSEKADEYPSFATSEDGMTEINLRSEVLADAISKGRNFVSTDILRPQMTAIYAYIKDGEFGYCGTDTHKLIHGHCQIDDADGVDVNWYVMPQIFAALATVCKNHDNVKIQITDTHTSYRIGDSIIRCVQAKGSFPNFKRVIPQTWAMECSVGKSDILDTISRVSMFCPESSRCLKMAISPMDMVISADDIDNMKSSKENVTHGGCDGDITIGMNADHIAVAMSVFDGDILMRMTDPTKPMLMVSPDNDNVKAICMPLNISGQ